MLDIAKKHLRVAH